MIYVTGDLHGDEKRLRPFKRGLLRKNPYLLVCGDFGFVWDDSEREKAALSRLERLDCTILFVEGTHDNLDLLSAFPQEEMFGAPVRRVRKNIFWLSRGEIYTIEDKTVFAFGGAESPDADSRTEGVSWWKNEYPTTEEMRHAAENILARDSVDIIITHQNPGVALGEIGEYEHMNTLKIFLRKIMTDTTYGHWYFGGDHVDRAVSPHMTAVFEKIIPATEKKGRKEK